MQSQVISSVEADSQRIYEMVEGGSRRFRYYDTNNLPKVLHCMLLPDGCGSGSFCPSAVMVSKAVTPHQFFVDGCCLVAWLLLGW
ncbi:hypothetical protein LXL04_015840 [Taraxacum kok-saghyz]